MSDEMQTISNLRQRLGEAESKRLALVSKVDKMNNILQHCSSALEEAIILTGRWDDIAKYVTDNSYQNGIFNEDMFRGAFAKKSEEVYRLHDLFKRVKSEANAARR